MFGRIILWLLGLTLTGFQVGAQEFIRGTVTGKMHDEHHDEAHAHALSFANVYWAGGTSSVTTGEDGSFKIARTSSSSNLLVASFVGFRNDTVEIRPGQRKVDFVLESDAELGEVVISEHQDGQFVSRIKPIKTEIITEAGLQKLACCNLSESFENSATVDVGYTDAVSGARKIQMLGLSGIYSQLLSENVPSVRGLASNYGLSFIPGSWMQSIQVSKGTSSVVAGYESTTGQINVEYRKPEHTEDRLFINLFGNDEARFEANINGAIKVSERISTMLLTHASFNTLMIDHNKDGFLDSPTGWQVNAMNRWTFEDKNDGHTQVLLHYLNDNRNGGQINYYDPPEGHTDVYYGSEVLTQRIQAIIKSGFRFSKPYQSLGIIASGTWHDQKSAFGQRKYNGEQKSVYLNTIYQSIISNTNHQISTGASFMLDHYDESLTDSAFSRLEYVPGAFFQYTFSHKEKLNIILGLRTDYHNLYGLLITPRFHFKWNPAENTTIRASAGRGFRSPSGIAENSSYLASNRMIRIIEDFRMEEAWNYGMNVSQDFHIDENRKITLTADFYRTDFVNRLVVDIDQDVHSLYFYNLTGRSYSNSFQFDFMIQPLKRFDVSLAFRWNDSKTSYGEELLETPFVSRYKGLMTISYATRFEKWKFDFTAQYNGRSRLPNTSDNPEPYARASYSKEYYMLHAQVTKKWRIVDWYVGAENLLNFTQHHPIVSADDPGSPYFDASMIWGPLMGRTFYTGLRLKIK